MEEPRRRSDVDQRYILERRTCKKGLKYKEFDQGKTEDKNNERKKEETD